MRCGCGAVLAALVQLRGELDHTFRVVSSPLCSICGSAGFKWPYAHVTKQHPCSYRCNRTFVNINEGLQS